MINFLDSGRRNGCTLILSSPDSYILRAVVWLRQSYVVIIYFWDEEFGRTDTGCRRCRQTERQLLLLFVTPSQHATPTPHTAAPQERLNNIASGAVRTYSDVLILVQDKNNAWSAPGYLFSFFSFLRCIIPVKELCGAFFFVCFCWLLDYSNKIFSKNIFFSRRNTISGMYTYSKRRETRLAENGISPEPNLCSCKHSTRIFLD